MPPFTWLITSDMVAINQRAPASTAQIALKGSAHGAPFTNYSQFMATKGTRFRSAVGRLPLLTILAVSIFLHACSPTMLLQDQFKSDVIGQKPIRDIPGEPPGDKVEFTPNFAQRLAIVSFPGVASGKGLEFSSQPLVDGTLFFDGTQTSDFSKSIKFSFTGKFDDFKDKILVRIMSDAAADFGRFGVRKDGTLVAYTDFGAGGEESLCTLQTDVIYLFTFSLDMVNKKTANEPQDGYITVGILGDVTVNGEAKSGFNVRVSLLDKNNPLKHLTGSLRPVIGFQWDDQWAVEGVSPSKFTMSDVAISQ